jgi:hypothetical protein
MLRKNICIPTTACIIALALAMACSRTPETPVAPSGAESGNSDAGADGSTLKVTAPTPKSPVNGQQPDGNLVLTAGAASGKFANVGPLSHRFQIINAANAVVCNMLVAGGDGDATVTPASTGCTLDFDVVYSWQVRGEIAGGAFGPWSSKATFRSPVGGYLKGNELFDPLTNGPSTVMNASRDVTWLQGQGVRLNSKDSYVEWKLQQPCTDCEFSALMTNIGNGSEEWKTKVMSMLEEGVNTTENRYRVTIDKRTTWVGQGSRVRYTICSGTKSGACSEPTGGFQSWDRTKTYFWIFEWRGGLSRLRVLDGGINGSEKANLSQRYNAPYAPNPHLVRLGSVGGRADNESNPGTIIWNVWVSPNPRPNLPGDK